MEVPDAWPVKRICSLIVTYYIKKKLNENIRPKTSLTQLLKVLFLSKKS